MTIPQRADNRILLQPTLVLLMGIALVARLAVVLPLHSNYLSDERQYVNMAHRVLDGNGFVSENGERSTIAPLYIFLLAGTFTLFGSSLVIPHVMGCILGAAIVFLVYLVSYEVSGNRHTALFAAGAAGIYPSLVMYSGLLITETLYITFFLGAFLLAFKMVDRTSIRTSILFGVVSALATLTRAVFFGFFPLLLCLIWWMRKRERRHGVVHLLLAAAVWCVVLAPWTIRNYSVHHAFVPVSTGEGKVLLTGNNPFAPKSWYAEGFEEWLKERAAQRGVKNISALSEIERHSLYRELALDYAVSNPLSTILLMVQKVHIFSVYPITHSDSASAVQALAMAGDFVLYIGAVLGLVASWAHNRHRLMPLLVAIGFFLAVQVIFHAEARFRLPLIPFLCLLFGVAVSIVTDKQQRKEFLTQKYRVLATSAVIGCIVCVYAYTGVLFLTGKIS